MKPACQHGPPPGWEPHPYRIVGDGASFRRHRRCPSYLLNKGDQCGQPGGPEFPHYCRNHTLPVECSPTGDCRQCVRARKAEAEQVLKALRERKAAALAAPRKPRPTEPWQPPAGAAQAARATAGGREKRGKERDAELAAMVDGQLAALDPLISAADALRSDPTTENVAKLLAARPEAVNLDRLRVLQQPQPIIIEPGAYFTGAAVGEIGTLLYRIGYEVLGFEFGRLKRALGPYFGKRETA